MIPQLNTYTRNFTQMMWWISTRYIYSIFFRCNIFLTVIQFLKNQIPVSVLFHLKWLKLAATNNISPAGLQCNLVFSIELAWTSLQASVPSVRIQEFLKGRYTINFGFQRGLHPQNTLFLPFLSNIFWQKGREFRPLEPPPPGSATAQVHGLASWKIMQ